MQTPLLQAKGISKKYASHKGWFEREVIHAVKSVSFELNRGQTIAVVGETGSGKSTLAQLLSGDKVPDEGDILLHGQSLAQADLQQQPSSSHELGGQEENVKEERKFTTSQQLQTH